MVNPQSLNLNSLPWLPLEEKTAFPRKSAIYFAIDSLGAVQYIGRSVNVRQRWGNHHKYDELANVGNIKIAYLFVDAVVLLPEIEAALIDWFDQPLYYVHYTETQNFKGRKQKAFRLDTRVIDAFNAMAKKQGISANRLLEIHLFNHLQQQGFIDKDMELLGETRGGDQKSNKARSKDND